MTVINASTIDSFIVQGPDNFWSLKSVAAFMWVQTFFVITDVEITISLFNFQVTDSNSRLLNRAQTVTDSNKTAILPFVFVYCTLNK